MTESDTRFLLALALGVVILMAGGPAAPASFAVDPKTKAARWRGQPHLAKVSGHLLKARELARRGAAVPEIRAELPLVHLTGGLLDIEVRLEEVGVSVEQQLSAAGMEVAGVYPRYRRAVGRCPLERLDEIAAIPEVATIHPLYGPRVWAGSVSSQGEASINADDARLAFGVDGSGVTVGVLSDSFHSQIGGTTSAAVCSTPSGDLPVAVLSGSAPQVSGDLPASVTVLDNCDTGDFCASGVTDEGAALAEVIHDLAPGAEVLFHTAFRSEADFAEGISELAACGADVFVDDVIWPAEPMFQDGIIAQEAQAVVDAGAVYFSAAGNGADRGVDEGFQDANVTDDSEFPTTGVDLHDFGGGDRFAAITVPPGCGIDLVLQWNQPFLAPLGSGSANDLDLYLCRTDDGAQGGAGGILLGCDPDDPVDGALAESTESQGCSGLNPSGDPFEIVSYFNSGATPVTGYLAVEHYCGDQTDVKFRIATFATGPCGLANSGYGFEAGIFDQPQIYGHPAAAGVQAVGAVNYGEIDSGGALEAPAGEINVKPSSSLGGNLPFYFDDDGDPLAGAPETRFKPDLAAPEGVNTTFFGVDVDSDPDSFPNFFGTSAAVPHAAAVAALMLDRYPALTGPEIRGILAASAWDIETAGIDALSGSGLVDAHAALTQTPFSQLGAAPSSVDFGAVEVGTSSPREITLSNTGTADLHVLSIDSSDPTVFTPAVGGSSPCANLTPTLPVAGSCTIQAVFSPSALQHDGELAIQSDTASGTAEIVSLTGTGFTACTSDNERVLPEPPGPINGALTEEACISLTAGPYAIGPTGDVIFVAGQTLVLRNGFQVEGSFEALLNPLLLPVP